MDKGVYCLILECERLCTVQIGALGRLEFQKGWYIYVGSALGSGGLSRVSRHVKFFREQYRRPKWHIDYLMAAENIFLRGTVCGKTCETLECVIAEEFCGSGVANFGCSDCDCATHLFYREADPLGEVCEVFERAGLCAEKYFLV